MNTQAAKAEQVQLFDVKGVRDLVGIPERAADYYDKETIPQCWIQEETENFIVFIWRKGYYGPAGDWTLIRIYVVHKPSKKWCHLVELDQTWGGTWYKFDGIEDYGGYLDLTISAHCKSSYGTVTDYDRDIFEARVSESQEMGVFRKKNPVVEEERRIAIEKKLAEERKLAQKSVAELLGGEKVSDANLRAMVEFCQDSNWPESTKVISPDVIICVGRRHLDSGSAGMGYFSQIHIWYKGQKDMREWQWRDCYSASADRPELFIYGVGEIEVESSDGKVKIKIELLNREHGSRYTTFTFEDKEADIFPELPEERQAQFTNDFETETGRVLAELEKRWILKHQMLTSQGYVNYERPAIKQCVIDAVHGIGAFVSKEQIDHRAGGERQTRFELFIMRVGDIQSKRVWEDHGYEKSEGARAISITSLNPHRIQIATHGGLKIVDIG